MTRMVRGKKPIYLLAGGRGGSEVSSILNEVFRELDGASRVVAYVGAANGDNPDFFRRMDAIITSGRDCEVVRTDLCSQHADVSKAVDIIDSADAIFMSGGDVEAGMQVLNDRNIAPLLLDLYLQGKLFFGVSAGSIMLAREWVRWPNPEDNSTAELFPCVGLANLICDTHGEADGWEELTAALTLSTDGAAGYGITSGTCLKVMPDGSLQAMAGPIARYLRRNGIVGRQPDLIP